MESLFRSRDTIATTACSKHAGSQRVCLTCLDFEAPDADVMLCLSTPVIVPDNADNMSNPQSDMPGSAIGAMNGTIWPHAAVSSAPTPTAEVHHDPSNQNGMQDTTSMFMDGLGAVSYGLEDINWENSLLMPVRCHLSNRGRRDLLTSTDQILRLSSRRGLEASVNWSSVEVSYIPNSVAVSWEP